MSTRRPAPATLADYARQQTKQELERDIQKAAVAFLRAHGWRVYRMNSGMFQGSTRPVRVGEPGMADLLAHRYVIDDTRARTHGAAPGTGVSYVIWIECKRASRGKLHEDQVRWRLAETENGALIYTCSNIDDLRDWYYQRFGFLHKTDNLFVAVGVKV